MRDDAKLSDGVVTLSPLDPADAARLPFLPPSPPGAPWRAHGPAQAFGIRAGRLVGAVRLRPAATRAGAPAPGGAPAATGPSALADHDADLSFVLEPEARGRGLATRAVLLACGHARAAGARRAVIVTTAGDATASAVALRAGFAHRGQISHADGTLLDWHVRPFDRP
ncbi:GNAT family N-acetyltransferase [Streptomyces roseicoloratus]|uniref:GNAT family N-acetyltransferase n=2 Tax=Streptomyces roseicoloratus TaxID=2508722 RepID=A0ABY9RRJ8_9ACTN|nr:GNAT family N-acetyltransferase [Streptomyces roseicoloratus]WMX43859.1 GNAT family N-acetyltransferase [Streptomyces roseicoloratus]